MNPLDEICSRGVVVLKNCLDAGWIAAVGQAAGLCFQEIEGGRQTPAHYGYNPYSHSLLADSLLDFGCTQKELYLPASVPIVRSLAERVLGPGCECRPTQSWLRKKLAPSRIADRNHPLQNWHQDGALGVRFPLVPGALPPMTELLTCWVPLSDAGLHRPGLEFVTRRCDTLLHFIELDDCNIRARFNEVEFWAPSLEPGDCVLFLDGTLHRTHATSSMTGDRLSMEYRFFPAKAVTDSTLG